MNSKPELANNHNQLAPKLVKLSSKYAHSTLQRQTPGKVGRWGGYQFSNVGERVISADFWFVLDGVRDVETAQISSGKVILLCHEPPDLKNYHPAFLAQFDAVYACHRKFRHRNQKLRQQGLPWLAGQVGKRGPADHYEAIAFLSYDDFSTMVMPRKPELVSTVLSTISKTRGHKQRQQFVELVAAQVPELDIFGRGRTPVADKMEAILPYQFHLALENSAVDHYWTEKLADAYLCHAFPIYWGAPNLASYFPPDSFLQIRIDRPEEAIRSIRNLLDSGLSRHQLEALAEARNLVLNKYNIYALMADACDEFQSALPDAQPAMRTIKPEKAFRGFRIRQAAQRLSRWTRARTKAL